MMSQENHRSIRSFVLRQGRMTPSQKRAMETLWSHYGIDLDKPLDLTTFFANKDNATVIEIGFGMGHSLIEMAKANPDINYIGIEVHQPGVGRLMHQLEENQLNNVKVINDDAIKALEETINDHSIDGVQIYFPDPWPKKKHHKRRLIQKPFIELLHKKLKPQGFLHLATDWEDYALHMEEVLKDSAFKQTPTTIHRPESRFESRGKKLGHEIFEYFYQKQ